MMSRSLLALALALALATACGTRTVPLGSTGAPPGSEAVPSEAQAASAQQDDALASRAGEGGAGNPFAGTEATGRLAGPRQTGTLRLRVTITPGCGGRGTPMVAQTKSAPGAAIAFAVAYADGQTYGQFGTGRALPDGSFSYAWTVPPVAPYGQGKFLFGASDEAKKKSGAGIWPFEVAPPGSCSTAPTASSN